MIHYTYSFITNKYRGLNHVEDSFLSLVLDIKKFSEKQTIREENYEKVSRDVGRDITFSKAS